jgi:hypothetical protein
MSDGHRNWLTDKRIEVLQFENDNPDARALGLIKVRTQAGPYVSVHKCADACCPVLLAWHNSGSIDMDGRDQFGATNCQCDEQSFCCTDHRDTYECPLCMDGEEEEEEEEKEDGDEKEDGERKRPRQEENEQE